jgi:hypothetical protein
VCEEWQEMVFERKMRAALKAEFGPARGEGFYSRYIFARGLLSKDILPSIMAVEPALTDHGPQHIRNVMENVYSLLPDGYHKKVPVKMRVGWEKHHLAARDQYMLAHLVLFHDVGNIFGRKGHQDQISQVYDYVWGEHTRRHPEEKEIIVRGAGAHCGEALDGSKDTLAELSDVEYFEGGNVRLREISSLLRFADELAEGPQRTSEFMRRMGKYPQGSKVFHDYAAATRVNIDRTRGRIVLRYDFHIEQLGNPKGAYSRLKELLVFTYERITKLDQERKYSRFYSELLSPFAVTIATFCFWVNGKPSDLNLDPIIFDDKIVPGDLTANILDFGEAYEPDAIIKTLKQMRK